MDCFKFFLASPQQSSRLDRGVVSNAATFVAIACLVFNVFAIFVGFHHSIFDFHGFRQAQTAISVEYMEHGGAFLRYQTPVLGPPWPLPFEFPLYQKIVAVIAEHLRLPLDETGRGVSIAFFYLCFFPIASILKRLRYKPVQILVVLSLFAVSPLYIFVSRLFMIESTVLFFSLMYLEMISPVVTGSRRYGIPRHGFRRSVRFSCRRRKSHNTSHLFFYFGSAILLWHLWRAASQAIALPRVSRVAAASCHSAAVVPCCAHRLVGQIRRMAVREQESIFVLLPHLERHADSGTFGPLLNACIRPITCPPRALRSRVRRARLLLSLSAGDVYAASSADGTCPRAYLIGPLRDYYDDIFQRCI